MTAMPLPLLKSFPAFKHWHTTLSTRETIAVGKAGSLISLLQNREKTKGNPGLWGECHAKTRMIEIEPNVRTGTNGFR
jgi:hypothetical protein